LLEPNLIKLDDMMKNLSYLLPTDVSDRFPQSGNVDSTVKLEHLLDDAPVSAAWNHNMGETVSSSITEGV